jgi:conjugative transfer signal peptidase TraF
MLGATGLLLLATSNTPSLIWNATASAPTGLYALIERNDVKRGDLVLAFPPRDAQLLAATRGYLPLGVPVVKYVAALVGDRICVDGFRMVLNGKIVAQRLAMDSEGRALPAWSGCQTMGPDDVFLLNARVQHSFDSRYWGPVSRAAILGKLVSLWTH